MVSATRLYQVYGWLNREGVAKFLEPWRGGWYIFAVNIDEASNLNAMVSVMINFSVEFVGDDIFQRPRSSHQLCWECRWSIPRSDGRVYLPNNARAQVERNWKWSYFGLPGLLRLLIFYLFFIFGWLFPITLLRKIYTNFWLSNLCNGSLHNCFGFLVLVLTARLFCSRAGWDPCSG